MDSSTSSHAFDGILSRIDSLYTRDSIEHQSLEAVRSLVSTGDYQTAEGIVENLQITSSDKEELIAALKSVHVLSTPRVSAYPEPISEDIPASPEISGQVALSTESPSVPLPPIPPPPAPIQGIQSSSVQESNSSPSPSLSLVPPPPPPPSAPIPFERESQEQSPSLAPSVTVPSSIPSFSVPSLLPQDVHAANYDLIAQTKPTVNVDVHGIEVTKNLIRQAEPTVSPFVSSTGEYKAPTTDYSVPAIIKTYDKNAEEESNTRIKEKEIQTQIEKAKPLFDKLELYMKKAYTTADADSLIASAERQYTHLQRLYPDYARRNIDHIDRINALRNPAPPLQSDETSNGESVAPELSGSLFTQVTDNNEDVSKPDTQEDKIEASPDEIHMVMENQIAESTSPIENNEAEIPYIPYTPPIPQEATQAPVERNVSDEKLVGENSPFALGELINIPEPEADQPVSKADTQPAAVSTELPSELAVKDIHVSQETVVPATVEAPDVQEATEVVEDIKSPETVLTTETVPLPVVEKNVVENPRILHSYDIAGMHITWGMKISTDRDIYIVDRIQEFKNQVTIIFRGGMTGRVYFVPAQELGRVLGSDEVHPDEFFADFVKVAGR